MHIIPFLPKQWGIYHLFFCTKKTVEKSLQSRTMWSCYSSLKPYNFALIACQRVNVFWLRDRNFDVALLLPTYTHKECFIVQHCRLLQKKKIFWKILTVILFDYGKEMTQQCVLKSKRDVFTVSYFYSIYFRNQ